MAVSKRLRHEVMRRDNHTCKYCGATAPDVKLTIDHVTPTTLGGSDEPSNLVTACADCNAGKSATPPDAALVAAVDERAVQWSQAMQVAVEQRAAELAAERGRTDRFDQEWRGWNAGGEEVWRDQNWRASVLRLLAAGLTDDFLVDAVGIAMRSRVKASDTWRYFCGVCWREVDKVQSIAAAIADKSKELAAEPADDIWDDVFRLRSPFKNITIEPSGNELAAENRYSLGAHPLFPSVELAERFATRLIEALDGSPYIVDEAKHVLWDAMEASYAAFMADDVDWAGSSDPRVFKAFDAATDGLLFRIKLTSRAWSPVSGDATSGEVC